MLDSGHTTFSSCSYHLSVMQIYWTPKSLPELRDLEASLRRKVWRACWLRSFRHWQTWAAFVSQFVLILVGAFVGLVADGQLWILGWALRGDSLVGRETGQFPWATVLLMQVGALVGGF